MRSAPTQPYMGPPGLQVASGGAQRIGPTQVSPGTVTKWNGGVQFEQSFPKPAGQIKESFVMSEPEIEEGDCCSGYCCRWISDHLAKVLLLVAALGVFVLTIMALVAGLNTLSSNGFFYYSKFAWEQWFPSFFVIMVMLMLLSLAAMVMVLFGGFISVVEKRALVRAFYISSLTLGAIMLGLALFCWLYGNRAKPYVIRAGNLLCQDPKIWHCSGVSLRTLMEDNKTSQERIPRFHSLQEKNFHSGFDVSFADKLEATTGAVFGRRLFENLRRPGASERRLNPAAASLAFVESLNRAVDPRTHEPEGCGTIMDICQPPPTFNTTTACVCSGNWDFAPVGTTSVQPPAATTAVEAVLPNTEGTTTEPTNPFAAPTATVVTLQPQVPAAEETAAADTDSTTAASASSESAEAQPAAGNAAPTGRRLREDVGPWMGSLGAFCGKWGNDDFVTGEWCFVLPSQQCSPNARSQYVSTRGYPMIRSTAPCSGEVDSRSALLLLGHEEMMNPLKFVALLGAALWLFAGTGYMLYLYPSHETKYEALRSQPRRQQRESPIHGFGGFGGPQVEMYSPELVEQQNTSYNMRRFQEAQAKAVNKLSRNTPEDLRLQIYAYYKQATEGDAQGDRPTYFKQKERAKYDAWVKCRGMSFDDAVDKYCQVVDRI